jgi:hypothetical protein
MAVPPSRKTLTAVIVARGWEVAAIPFIDITGDRPGSSRFRMCDLPFGVWLFDIRAPAEGLSLAVAHKLVEAPPCRKSLEGLSRARKSRSARLPKFSSSFHQDGADEACRPVRKFMKYKAEFAISPNLGKTLRNGDFRGFLVD